MIQVIKQKMINFVKIFKCNKANQWEKVIIRKLLEREDLEKDC